MAEDNHDEWGTVGERIRLAREARGISVRELSRRVDVSPGHVSQVERGLASFSVRALYTVANELGISMDSLFEADDTEEVETAPPPSAATDALEDLGMILRADQRPAIQLSDGPRWERLTAKPEESSEFLEVVYAPATGTEGAADMVRHVGREYGLVVAGELHVQVGYDRSVLRTGDTIAFDSDIPHRFWNESAEEVHAIWFVLEGSGDDTGGDQAATGVHSSTLGRPRHAPGG